MYHKGTRYIKFSHTYQCDGRYYQHEGVYNHLGDIQGSSREATHRCSTLLSQTQTLLLDLPLLPTDGSTDPGQQRNSWLS